VLSVSETEPEFESVSVAELESVFEFDSVLVWPAF
jgi:hypothetical protein